MAPCWGATGGALVEGITICGVPRMGLRCGRSRRDLRALLEHEGDVVVCGVALVVLEHGGEVLVCVVALVASLGLLRLNEMGACGNGQ